MNLKLFYQLTCLLFSGFLWSQCPTGNIEFRSQADINQFKADYPNCTQIPGNVSILYTSGMSNVSGLEQITDIAGNLIVYYNYGLTSLEGLNNLKTIGGFLQIRENGELLNLNGLNSLKSIGGGLNLEINVKLDNVDALSNLSNVKKLFVVSNWKLRNLDGLANLTSVGNDELYLFGNSLLTDISGISNVNPQTITNVNISSNPLLTVCNLPNICSYLAYPANNYPRFISDNKDTCADLNAVLAACANSQTANYSAAFGNNVLMNGSTDNIDLGTSFADQEFTLEMWVKPGATQQIYADIADNNHLGIQNWRNWVVQQNGGSNPNQYLFTAHTASSGVSVTFELQPNVWQHLALVKTATALEVYVNGVLIQSTPWTGTINYSSQFLRLGRWGGGGRQWNGNMDEVRYWNTARTQGEITTNMNNQLTGNETGLIGYWDMNRNGQGAGLTVENKATNTGTSLDGITVGSATTPVFSSDGTLSVSTLSEHKLQVYPNPAKDFVTLDNLSKNTTIKISDMAGKLIQVSTAKDSKQNINVSNLVNGVYFVEVNDNGKISNQKLIIRK